MPKRVGIYVRISTVDASGNETATARQEADCREVVARDGDDLVRVYRDVDRSAYDLSTERPAFEEMLRDAAQGNLDRLLAWKWDRLCRSLLDAGRLHQLVEVKGIDVNTVMDPISSWSSSSAALEVGIRAGLGAGESKSTSMRLKRVSEERAAQGLPHAGGRRGFGMKNGHLEIDEAEAAIVRDCAARALDGESLMSVARDLNDRGVTTTRNGTWNASNLRRLLTAPHVAGRRMFRGEIVDSDVIPAILDEATWVALTKMLNDPKRSTRHAAEMNRPLSGTVRCGTCASVMTPRTRRSEGQRPSYVCRKEPGKMACGGRSISADDLDQYVLASIIERVETDPLSRALIMRDDAEDASIADRLLAVRDARLDAVRLFSEGHLTASELVAAQQTSAETARALEAELVKRGSARVLAGVLASDHLEALWNERGNQWARELVRLLINSIEVAPNAVRGRQAFDPDRITIHWAAD